MSSVTWTGVKLVSLSGKTCIYRVDKLETQVLGEGHPFIVRKNLYSISLIFLALTFCKFREFRSVRDIFSMNLFNRVSGHIEQ